jgi:hypothetical protein
VQLTTTTKGFTRQCVGKRKKKEKQEKKTGGKFCFSLSFQGRTDLHKLLGITALTGSTWGKYIIEKKEIDLLSDMYIVYKQAISIEIYEMIL